MSAICQRPLLVLGTSFCAFSCLGTGYLYAVWSDQGVPIAVLRSALFVAVMAAVHLVGFRMYMRQFAPAGTHPLRQGLPGLKPHREAILAQQLPVLLLAALLLDGGLGLRVCLIACLAHWLIIALILTRTVQPPAGLDRGLIRWGFFPCLAIAIGLSRLV